MTDRRSRWRVTIGRDLVAVRLAYGKDGLEVDRPPGRTTVVEPLYAEAHLEHTEDVADAVERALREADLDSRVCVLSEGPQTLPHVG